jgi:hypothetical protein
MCNPEERRGVRRAATPNGQLRSTEVANKLSVQVSGPLAVRKSTEAGRLDNGLNSLDAAELVT